MFVYHESIKRDLKRRPISECRCDERLKTKAEESTRLAYTGLLGELEHLKIETRLIDEMFVSVMGEYVSRNDINLDMLIWLSESSLSDLFSEVSLIRDNQVREFKENSLIIKGLDNQVMKTLIITDNQDFHHVSPKFFNSPDDSPAKHLTE